MPTPNEIALSEFKETRALALAGAVDAVSSRAIGLRIDLAKCMEDNERLKKEVAELRAELDASMGAEANAAPG